MVTLNFFEKQHGYWCSREDTPGIPGSWRIIHNSGVAGELIEAADELEACCSYFNLAAEPELVDQAVSLLQTAEKKYFDLMRAARKQKLPEAFLSRFDRFIEKNEIIMNKI